MSEPLSLLICDDDEVMVLNAQRAFKQQAMIGALFVARDGFEALAVLRGSQLPRRLLVLLDIHMPRLDGLQTLLAIRADAALRATIVVMLTTSTNPSERAAAYELNVAGYLQKPLTQAAFAEMAAAFANYWARVETP